MPTIDRRILVVALSLVSSVAISQRVSAQEAPAPSGGGSAAAAADSLPFRAGQWGADFAVNNGAVGLGVLRFRSPRTAWVLDAAIGADWSTADWRNADGTVLEDQESNNLSLRLRSGPRRYLPIAASVATFFGAGVTSQLYRAHSAPTDAESRGWDVGAFGEIGAAYLVTRRLSLGAQTALYATYGETLNRVRNETGVSFVDVSGQRTRIELTPVRIVGALYF